MIIVILEWFKYEMMVCTTKYYVKFYIEVSVTSSMTTLCLAFYLAWIA